MMIVEEVVVLVVLVPLRIIWGPGRSYPSTLTVDQSTSAIIYFWKDISGNSRHSKITDTWEPYLADTPGEVTSSSGSGGFFYRNLINFANTIEVGQTAVIPEIKGITGTMTNTYELYNLPGDQGSITGNGSVSYNSVIQSPVVGPIRVTIGTREFFRFGGTTDGIQHSTLRIPPQQVPYNAVLTIHENDSSFATAVTPTASSSIENEIGSVLNVPFDSSVSRLGVCDGTGSASAYTGVTGTAARTVILGVKFPAILHPLTLHFLMVQMHLDKDLILGCSLLDKLEYNLEAVLFKYQQQQLMT